MKKFWATIFITAALMSLLAAGAKASELSFSHPSGFYEGEFTLSIDCDMPWAKIYYTVDGTVPDPSKVGKSTHAYTNYISVADRSGDANFYSETENIVTPITDEDDYRFGVGDYLFKKPAAEIPKITVITAVAVSGGKQTQPVRAVYVMGAPAAAFEKMTVISLCAQGDELFGKNGIYVYPNYLEPREISAHTEVLKGGKSIAALNTKIKISDESIVDLPQKSFELKASGGNFNRLFGAGNGGPPCEGLILYAGRADKTLTGLRAVVMDGLAGGYSAAGRGREIAAVFLNGEFWGVYTVCEPYDSGYFERRYGALGAVSFNLDDAADDSRSDSALLFALGKDLSRPENYQKLCDEYINIDSFIDYISSCIFASNTQGLKNCRVWYAAGESDKRLRFLPHTHETGLTNWGWAGEDTISALLDDEDGHSGTKLFKSLMKSAEFKKSLGKKLALYISTIYSPEKVKRAIDKHATAARGGFFEHAKRWAAQDAASAAAAVNSKINYMLDFPDERVSLLTGDMPGGLSHGLGLPMPFKIGIRAAGGLGSVFAEGIPLDDSSSEVFGFSGVLIRVSAAAREGFGLKAFNLNGQIIKEDEIEVDPVPGLNILAEFESTEAPDPPPEPFYKGAPFFYDNFKERAVNESEDKFLITDNDGAAVYTVDKLPKSFYGDEQEIKIDPERGLLIGNGFKYHGARLERDLLGGRSDFALSTKIVLQSAGNEGSINRPIFYIKLREGENGHYALAYHMVNTTSNIYIYQWSLINTGEPGEDITPLATGFKTLLEGQEYLLTAKIQGEPGGGVSFEVYIDDPANPAGEYAPLIKYTDYSDYRITENEGSISFGAVGFSDAIWGLNPYVYYDDIALYDIDVFSSAEDEKAQRYTREFNDMDGHWAGRTVKNLSNLDVTNGAENGGYKPDDRVTLAEMLKLLFAAGGTKFLPYDGDALGGYLNEGIRRGYITLSEAQAGNEPITRFTAAKLLFNIGRGARAADERYSFVAADFEDIPVEYKKAVIYSALNGYMEGFDDFTFRGGDPLTRAQAAVITERFMFPGLGAKSYPLTLPHILTDGCVLQMDKDLPVWGRGTTGDTITVTLGGQTVKTVVSDGEWRVTLPPFEPGGPYTLSVRGGAEAIEINDVYIGEVFLVAGQSNAEWAYVNTDNYKKTRSFFDDKEKVHIYNSYSTNSVITQFDNYGTWNNVKDVPSEIDWTSAIGAYFLLDMCEKMPELTEIHTALIVTAYGGTTIEAFLSPEAASENGYEMADGEGVWSGFYNGFIAPVSPFATRAVLYYQGEQSAHLKNDYEPLLKSYINGMRRAFDDEALPFALVQLAGFGINGDDDEWPYTRAVQSRVSNSLENVGIVSAIDLGDDDPFEIHPTLKQPIGQRLSAVIREMVYGEDIPCMGPLIDDFWDDGERFYITFDYVYGGLLFADGVPRGFEVLSVDDEWTDALAEIDGDTLVIWSDDVQDPVGVRYAWKNYPEFSLYNLEGFPAFPFNTMDSVR